MTTTTIKQCVECWRRFDLTDEDDAAEWALGHDCEPPAPSLPSPADRSTQP